MKKTLFIIAATILIFAIGAGLLYAVTTVFLVSESTQDIAIDSLTETTATSSASDLIGTRVPGFDLPMVNGTTTDFYQQLTQPTVVLFWTTWNERAGDQLILFDRYLKQNQNPSFNFLAVAYQEDKLRTETFVRRGGYETAVLLDESGEVGNNWRVHSVPTIYLVDKDGIIRHVYYGLTAVDAVVNKLLEIIP